MNSKSRGRPRFDREAEKPDKIKCPACLRLLKADRFGNDSRRSTGKKTNCNECLATNRRAYNKRRKDAKDLRA
jgi:hypothetical protein